jgi:hypothetical protein
MLGRKLIDHTENTCYHSLQTDCSENDFSSYFRKHRAWRRPEDQVTRDEEQRSHLTNVVCAKLVGYGTGHVGCDFRTLSDVFPHSLPTSPANSYGRPLHTIPCAPCTSDPTPQANSDSLRRNGQHSSASTGTTCSPKTPESFSLFSPSLATTTTSTAMGIITDNSDAHSLEIVTADESKRNQLFSCFWGRDEDEDEEGGREGMEDDKAMNTSRGMMREDWDENEASQDFERISNSGTSGSPGSLPVQAWVGLSEIANMGACAISRYDAVARDLDLVLKADDIRS